MKKTFLPLLLRYVARSLIFILLLNAPDVQGANDHPSPFSDQEETTHDAAPEESPLEPFDPFEPLNRVVFEFNRVLDGLLINPGIHIYQEVLPTFVQKRVHNVLVNLSTPLFFANNLLQGKLEKAGQSLTRFLINSTFGILGLFDVASEMGVPVHAEDFGQTLGVWGFGPGPYFVLPILGPTDFRGIVGLTADYFSDPLIYYSIHKHKPNLQYAYITLLYIDEKGKHLNMLEHLEKDSLDYYAALRSLYWQRTYAKVTKDVEFDDSSTENLDEDLFTDHPTP